MAGRVSGKPERSRKRALELAPETFERLSRHHADAHCELDHRNTFELLVATVLSAQTTDVLVNRITPDLFARHPDAASLAQADPAAVEKILSRMGMFRQKTKNVVRLSQMLVEKHAGEVPRSLAQLVELPGVGRKTANVVLGVAFNAPEGVVVDTHVQRIAQRLGWTKNTTPEKIEQDLMRRFPRDAWDRLSHVLIFHGRRICFARKPACHSCPVNDVCPCAFKAENVGRKAPRVRTAVAKVAKLVKKAAKAKGPARGPRPDAPRLGERTGQRRSVRRTSRPRQA